MKYRVKIKNPKIKLSTWRYFNANTLGLIKRAVELFDEETKQEWRLESLDDYEISIEELSGLG